MAGNTKSYQVEVVDGWLTRVVVEHSPKAAHSVAEAIDKLKAGEVAFVRFGDWVSLSEQWRTATASHIHSDRN